MTDHPFRQEAIEAFNRGLQQEEDKSTELAARLRLPKWPIIAVAVSLVLLLAIGLTARVPVDDPGSGMPQEERSLLVDVLTGGAG
ncbi:MULTISPECIES: hypothetical protein [Actinoalloteichus]|uniref:Uncharacterized protein n=1 Tax=Actinoalloteichus fjordicus TaxID=1612552 RepID=A0AAC9LAE6_9PSEU|nr:MULTISPECIES: hypothetical protein [Actinoalloteichus]APU13951.1 hypothetical protein UA74_09440 [Actinoalloteichus fjordicus]APU19897.1 hypothetical protein UA75_09410 [Actinoalloteichus sp. GBA129-24]